MKRAFSLILVLIMMLSVLSLSAFAEFENTYTNTGDKALDIIEVARTQLGYMEGSLAGTVQGSNDVTKYGEWYGLPGQPWCAMFVSWCADQAEISTGVIPKHASCDAGMNWFINNGRWEYSSAYGGDYTPKASDIVYFGIKLSGGFDSTHVGIIYKVDSKNIYVLEGNSSAKVQTVSYSLSSAYVLGYATPDYEFDGIITYEPGEYITTATTLNVREKPTAVSGTAVIGKLSQGSRVTVTEIQNDYWGKIELDDGNEGWISLEYADRIFIVSYDANGGEPSPEPQEKRQNNPLTLSTQIPVRQGYDFLGWATEKQAAEPEYEAGDKLYLNADTLLFAVWREQGVSSYTVSFDANGGVGAPSPITKTAGKALTLPVTVPTRDGYVFKGWGLAWDSLTTAYRAGGVFTTDADTTLYAVWAEDDYGITVSATEGGIYSRTKNGSTVTLTIRAEKDHCISRLIIDGKDILLISDMTGYTHTFDDAEPHTVSIFFSSNLVGWDEPFTDVAKGQWYYDAVEYCYMNKLMNGIGQGLFDPNGNVTRAMFVTILSKVDGADTSPYGEPSFADVEKGSWYASAVEWAYANGYSSGIGGDAEGRPCFAPTGKVSREQLATFLLSYSQKKGYEASGRAELSSYTDSDNISEWALEAVRWAVDMQLISGTSLTTLDPKSTASRATVAVIMKKYVENTTK